MQAICKCCEHISKHSTKATTKGQLFLYRMSNGVHEAALWVQAGGDQYVVRLACDGIQVTDVTAPTRDEALRIAEEHTLFI